MFGPTGQVLKATHYYLFIYSYIAHVGYWCYKFGIIVQKEKFAWRNMSQLFGTEVVILAANVL